ncbi:MAG TPA: 3-deoxy-D-manno-octulosonic acid transferase [Rhizomicrobium sp.]|nr:3-deoxy-D-manno-octulosonic acid transferase [Rhizomicrobium sp.]
MDRLTPGLVTYRTLTGLFSPVANLVLQERAARGKENRERLCERMGRTSDKRPDGTLIWIHGASVGETLAALPLLSQLLTPGRSALVTSGTVTSAKLMAQRLPERAIHQFVPVDTPGAARRFLDHWRPNVGLFVDSDLWPNLLMRAAEQAIPLALVNARISARSTSGWKRAPNTAKALLSAFDGILAIDAEVAERFTSLGAAHVQVTGSLKADAPPLPADAAKLAALEAAIGTRPILLASSTHAGEDETLLPAHDVLKRDHPDLLTIIVPRHPDRGSEIAGLCGTRTVRRRTTGALPDDDTAIYVADTMGELGLFYRLGKIAFMGGSLIAHGGQNPLEPARLGCAVMAGPHTENFTGAYDAIFDAQGRGRVVTSSDIAALAHGVFTQPDMADEMIAGAAKGAARLGGALAKTRDFVEQLLVKHART